MKAARILLMVTAALIVVVGILFASRRMRRSSQDAATAKFREMAIAEVTRLTADLREITNQVSAMASQTDADDKWLSPHIIVMKSREWVVFVNKCNKEDPQIRDTFVCRASDGRHYESGFHFCKGTIVLLMEGQPDDLRSFIANHTLSELPIGSAPAAATIR